MGGHIGIINPGIEVEVKCVKCGEKFKTIVGQVTEKGKTPTQTTCKDCWVKIMGEIRMF